MRKFIVLVKATADSEAGVFPKMEAIEAMQAFNERLGEDGMWIDGAGLKPSADAARIAFGSDGPSVTTGPFALTPDLVESLAPVADFFAFGAEIWGQDDPLAALRPLVAPLGY